MIDKVLNKAEAIELFEKEAVLFGANDAIPFYRAAELFGEEAGVFFDRCVGGEYFTPGCDYNSLGAGGSERPFVDYLYKAGFFKLVTEHNYWLILKAHEKSEGGRIIDRYKEEYGRRIDELDAENERKRAERKAKRAATKSAREAAKKEQGEE